MAQGVQLSSSVASAKFRGTATDSDSLGGVVAANYLRSDTADTTTGQLTVQTDDGIRIGAGDDITMTMSSDNFTIAQTAVISGHKSWDELKRYERIKAEQLVDTFKRLKK